MSEHVDVLIVGAGLSGIGAACQLRTRLPGKSVAILESRARQRRHLGPVPLPGHPLGLRHVHVQLPLAALAQRHRARRRAADPRLRPHRRPRVRRRRADPLPPPGHRGLVGQRDRALDGHDRPRRRDDHDDHRLPVGLLGLLRLRAGLRAGVPRRRRRSAASSSTRSTGPRTSTTPASGSS